MVQFHPNRRSFWLLENGANYFETDSASLRVKHKDSLDELCRSPNRLRWIPTRGREFWLSEVNHRVEDARLHPLSKQLLKISILSWDTAVIKSSAARHWSWKALESPAPTGIQCLEALDDWAPAPAPVLFSQPYCARCHSKALDSLYNISGNHGYLLPSNFFIQDRARHVKNRSCVSTLSSHFRASPLCSSHSSW